MRKSLLEASPVQRYKAVERRYAGIGTVLMARLVVESFQQGGERQVLVAARPGSELFYKRLGLRRIPNTARRFLLDWTAAVALLDSVLA